MPERIYITGMGILSAIGNTTEETYRSLCQAKSGVHPIQQLSTRHQQEFPAAEVNMDTAALRALTGYSSEDYTRTTLLGIIAAREAVQHAGIDVSLPGTGLISSTTVAGMGRTEQHYHELLSGDIDLNILATHDCGDSTERIADDLGVDGFVTTVSTACSSAANAIMLGCRMIRAGRLKRVIVGGVDVLSRFTLNGFNTLMILDRDWCKPFDATRKGLNLGEGAAFLVIEGEQEAKRRGATVLAEISGYANANDAYHQTASSPEGQGARMAMEEALAMSGLQPTQIDYINMHGTGTGNNDLSEGTATQTLFGTNVPRFSSTKAFTGHTLAAAAGIEAVVSVLALQHGRIFPNLNFHQPMQEFETLIPVTELTEAPLQHVLSNSFGFGGNCSSLIFSKVNS